MCSFQELEVIQPRSKRLEVYRRFSQQLSAVIHCSPDGIWVCDYNGKVLIMNQAAEELNGCKASDMVGKNVTEAVERGLIDQSATLQVLKTGRPVSIMQYVKKTQQHLLVTGTPIYDKEGRLSLVVTHGRDITQLNATRRALEESQMVTAKYKEELSELGILELRQEEVIAESQSMRHVLCLALKLAGLDDVNILILGESGTGKGLLVKFIHEHSHRNKEPLIQINCAALPESLLEAELFGYEKGAFTGASEKGKAGLFELAQGGTLFLDEIADLPMNLQAKLLKYLDDKVVMRLGSLKPRRIDCTVVAATNQNLQHLTRLKEFRQDLFYRLSTFTLRIPPLRERPEDVLEMIAYFQRKYNKQYGMKRRLSSKTLRKLQAHTFPGNVRELKNLIKQAVVMGDEELLNGTVSHLKRAPDNSEAAGFKVSHKLGLLAEVSRFEKTLIMRAKEGCRNTRELASLLQVDQSTVVRKLKKHGLPSMR